MAGIPLNEKEVIQELRERVQDLISPFYDTDFNLLRWLQGYNFDLDVVAPKLRFHLRFRQSNWKLDNLPERNEGVHKFWPWGLLGQSGKADNSIVYVEQTGKNDFNGFLKAFSGTELLHARMFDYERMLREVMMLEKETGKQAGILYVMDLDGLKFDSSLIGLVNGPLKTITHVMSEHYVELFKHFIVVNAPGFVYQIWRLVHPLLPHKTKEKVRILSPNWRQEILEFVDPSVLPSRWNTAENNIFSSQLSIPTKVPQSLFPLNNDLPTQNSKTIVIAHGKSELVTIHVQKPGTNIKFGFHADREFGFGILFSEDAEEMNAEKMTMVYPQFNKIVGPTTVPINDQISCDKSGYYKLWFSNSHAWWNSLILVYFVELV